jgi:hypothetical protein
MNMISYQGMVECPHCHEQQHVEITEGMYMLGCSRCGRGSPLRNWKRLSQDPPPSMKEVPVFSRPTRIMPTYGGGKGRLVTSKPAPAPPSKPILREVTAVPRKPEPSKPERTRPARQKTKTLTFRLSPTLALRLRQIALHECMSQTAIVERLITDFPLPPA